MSTVLRNSPGVPRPSASRDEPPAPGDEIDLLAYAGVAWRYRYVLVAVALVVGIVTYAINRSIAPTYEVVFRLMVTQANLGAEPVRDVNVVPFRELVTSPMLAAGLLDEFNLRSEPYRLTPQRFLASHVAVDVIRDSTIISVAVRLNDRGLVLKLAQRYSERVVELAQRLNVEGAGYTTQRIQQERDAALKNLATSEAALEEFRRGAQIELVRSDVDAMLLRRPEALDLTVEIQGELARVRQAETELARHDRVRSVRRSVDTFPAAAAKPETRRADPSTPREAPRPEKPAGSKEPDQGRQQKDGSPAPRPDAPEPPDRPRVPALVPPDTPGADLTIRSELLDPYVNPVYEALERDLAAARSRLASLQERRRELVSRLQLDAPSAQKLNRLYHLESGITKLTRENEVARSAYVEAANKYEEARLQTAMRAPRLQILDAPLPPDGAVAPRALRNTLAAILIALTMCVVAIIAYDASRQRTA